MGGNMNYWAWDGNNHVLIDSILFQRLFKVSISTWKNRINYQERINEIRNGSQIWVK
jgi:hypothetical protein